MLKPVIEQQYITLKVLDRPTGCCPSIRVAHDCASSQKRLGEHHGFIAGLGNARENLGAVRNDNSLLCVLATITSTEDTNFSAAVGETFRQPLNERSLAGAPDGDVAVADYGRRSSVGLQKPFLISGGTCFDSGAVHGAERSERNFRSAVHLAVAV